MPVHPRPCGEHEYALAASKTACNCTVHPRPCGEHAFTMSIRHLGQAVHPRPCGEHCAATCPRRCGTGSSPPVRGTPTALTLRFVGIPSRFIPARAGNTTCAGNRLRVYAAEVHPRPCGEHNVLCNASCVSTRPGSSPPVRGTHKSRSRFQGQRVSGSSPPVRGTPGHSPS